MQRYNIDRDGDLKKAQNGYVYLASDVDARIAEITENCTQINNAHQTRIDELEKALREAIVESASGRRDRGMKAGDAP